jgi:hypothetical protein
VTVLRTRKTARKPERRRALAERNIPKIKNTPQMTSIHGRTSARKKEITSGKTL